MVSGFELRACTLFIGIFVHCNFRVLTVRFSSPLSQLIRELFFFFPKNFLRGNLILPWAQS